jgi:hypothetical protein
MRLDGESGWTPQARCGVAPRARVCVVVIGREIAGQGFMKLMMSSVGVHGLTGLDRLFSFRCTQELTNIIKFYGAQVG